VAVAQGIYVFFETEMRFGKGVEAGGEKLRVAGDEHKLAWWQAVKDKEQRRCEGQ
jgi:hypothetical protein